MQELPSSTPREFSWTNTQKKVDGLLSELISTIRKQHVRDRLQFGQHLMDIDGQPFSLRTYGNSERQPTYEFSSANGRLIWLRVDNHFNPNSLEISDKFEGQNPEWLGTKIYFSSGKLETIRQNGPDETFFPIPSPDGNQQVVEVRKMFDEPVLRVGWEGVWLINMTGRKLEIYNVGDNQWSRVDFEGGTARICFGQRGFSFDSVALIPEALTNLASFKQALKLTDRFF